MGGVWGCWGAEDKQGRLQDDRRRQRTGSPEDPSFAGAAPRSHNTTAAQSSRGDSQAGKERRAFRLLAAHAPPSLLSVPPAPVSPWHPVTRE